MKSLELNQIAREPNKEIIFSSSSLRRKKADELTPVRRSRRLNAVYLSTNETQNPEEVNLEGKDDSEAVEVEVEIPEISGEKRDYESIRNARISENLARMESLGLLHASRELKLHQIISSSPNCKSSKKPKCRDRKVESPPIRRSSRLVGIYSNKSEAQSNDLKENEGLGLYIDGKESLSRRCESKGRGSIYDPVLGICCHFCRQKKLCGEEDCKRCGNGDANQPCIGKTECSVCHSSSGVLCRACLKVRYGEEMEEVRKNKEWMCPHCIEEKGIIPFWICNSSFCLKKRKLIPTGIAIYQARAKGYKSVAHLLMDQLKRQAAVQ